MRDGADGDQGAVIVGIYDLHLYCDGADCEAGKYKGRAELELTDEYGSACRRRARKLGWRLGTKDQSALCPSCVARGATIEEIS